MCFNPSMDFDFFSFTQRSLWALEVVLYLVGGGIAFFRSKMLIGLGLLLLFVTGALNWVMSVFLMDWFGSTFGITSDWFYRGYWILTGVVRVFAWGLTCVGLFTGLAPKAK